MWQNVGWLGGSCYISNKSDILLDFWHFFAVLRVMYRF